MNDAINKMLSRYDCNSIDDYENALKEIIQEVALLGLWRAKFFEKAAFYGGSSLRILYGLDRFSEDLDFSLLKKDKKFSLSSYCGAIKEELKSFGFSLDVKEKIKTSVTNIDSAFIKAGTLQNMIAVDVPQVIIEKLHSGKKIKIKLEVDTDPPGNFSTEAKYLFQPIPFSVNTYSLPCLFAGKVHAILCRSWKNRVKGRDWYDFIWYIGRDQVLDLKHLESRMKQTGHIGKSDFLTEDILKQMFLDRVESIDFNAAKRDVEHLVQDNASLSVWCKDFFKVASEKIRIM